VTADGTRQPANCDAATATVAPAATPVRARDESPPCISASEKGKGRAAVVTHSDRETGRVKSFRELDEEGSASNYETSAPAKKKRRTAPVKKQKAAGLRPAAATGERHEPPCRNCQRAQVECWKEGKGGACVRCIRQKHRCDYSRAWGGGKKGTKKEESDDDEVSAHLQSKSQN
jgi:hypothetical protein